MYLFGRVAMNVFTVETCHKVVTPCRFVALAGHAVDLRSRCNVATEHERLAAISVVGRYSEFVTMLPPCLRVGVYAACIALRRGRVPESGARFAFQRTRALRRTCGIAVRSPATLCPCRVENPSSEPNAIRSVRLCSTLSPTPFATAKQSYARPFQ